MRAARWGELVALRRQNVHLYGDDASHIVIDLEYGVLHENNDGHLWLDPPKTLASAARSRSPWVSTPRSCDRSSRTQWTAWESSSRSDPVAVKPCCHGHRTKRKLPGGAEGTRTPDPHTARSQTPSVMGAVAMSGSHIPSRSVRRRTRPWLLGRLLVGTVGLYHRHRGQAGAERRRGSRAPGTVWARRPRRRPSGLDQCQGGSCAGEPD